jgi:hypothetical protein
MVSKNDVARIWPFDIDSYQTGFTGRPTSKQLINTEFRYRCAQGILENNLKKESQYLHEWLKITHPEAPIAQPRSIENNIRQEYHAAKSAEK